MRTCFGAGRGVSGHRGPAPAGGRNRRQPGARDRSPQRRASARGSRLPLFVDDGLLLIHFLLLRTHGLLLAVDFRLLPVHQPLVTIHFVLPAARPGCPLAALVTAAMDGRGVEAVRGAARRLSR